MLRVGSGVCTAFCDESCDAAASVGVEFAYVTRRLHDDKSSEMQAMIEKILRLIFLFILFAHDVRPFLTNRIGDDDLITFNQFAFVGFFTGDHAPAT